jgi:hypothetical protein
VEFLLVNLGGFGVLMVIFFAVAREPLARSKSMKRGALLILNFEP